MVPPGTRRDGIRGMACIAPAVRPVHDSVNHLERPRQQVVAGVLVEVQLPAELQRLGTHTIRIGTSVKHDSPK
eukprot:242317-Alexandrium_andersonii.AAC.1